MLVEGDERAVTAVIGEVFTFGILVTSPAMYQVNAVVSAGDETSTRETAVSLGTRYESRTFSISPPDPHVTIRTNSTGNPQVEVTFDGGSTGSFNTSSIEYEPGNYEYEAPPTSIVSAD